MFIHIQMYTHNMSVYFSQIEYLLKPHIILNGALHKTHIILTRIGVCFSHFSGEKP